VYCDPAKIALPDFFQRLGGGLSNFCILSPVSIGLPLKTLI
jgi:hypothetical protein